jgi:amidase
VGADPGRLIVALQLEPFSGVPVDPECRNAALAAARLLEGLGHRVEEAVPDVAWEHLAWALYVLVASNVRLTVMILANGIEPGPDDRQCEPVGHGICSEPQG